MADPVPQQVVQYQTGFAPVVAPFAETLMGKAQALTDVKQNPYMQYMGERFAQFNPLQQKAFAEAETMRSSPQLEDASAMAGLAGLRAMGYGYQPGQFTNQFVAPQQFQPSQFTAPGVSSRELTRYEMGPVRDVGYQQLTAPQMQAAQSQYAPTIQAYQMGPTERVTTQSFARPGSAQSYMSPYMQSVVDIQQREAQRQADIAGTQRAGKYTRAGAFGGARQAIENAEAARNLAMQKGDIQATGLQQAYQQAQQQFNAEQAARLQAQQANQAAGLTIGGQNLAAQQAAQQLGVQTGLQTSLANLNAAQQAAVQNQAAQLQAQGMTAQQAMQAALANQQAGLTIGQQNLQAALGTQQLGAQQGLQAQLANQQAAMQAQQMAEQSKQYGYGQQLQAAGMGAQYGQAAQQLGEQSAQFGAGLGLQGLQTGLQASQQLGNLGQAQFGQNMGINQLLAQYGGQQQQQAQNILNTQYQDFQNFQNYPYKQLSFMSDILRGVPLSQTGSAMYQQAPSTASQLIGGATAAYGASKMFPFKAGGEVEDVAYRDKPAGLADLAIYNMGR